MTFLSSRRIAAVVAALTVLDAFAEPIRIGAIDCGAFAQRTAEVTEGKVSAGWADLSKESAADVFFYGNLGGRTFPSEAMALDGADVRTVLADGCGDFASVCLPDDQKAVRLVRTWNGKRLALYGVFLKTADSAVRRSQYRALMSDARAFDAVVFAGNFNAQTVSEYAVFAEKGFRLANGSSEFGTQPTSARAGAYVDRPMDNVIVSTNLDFAAFTIAQYFRIDTDHFPVMARIDWAETVAAERRKLPTVAGYFALPLAERRKWYADGAFRHQMKKAGYVRGEGVLSRWVDVDGIPNLRDTGGLRTLDGREMKRGLIYRSAGWNDNAKAPKGLPESQWTPGRNRLTAKGRKQLSELGIKTDLDLRTARECWGMTGSPLGSDVRWVRISFGSYARFKAKPEFRTAVKEVFDVLADAANYSLVFHCIGGADRTGCLALMIEELCGVDEDTAVADWELTGVQTEQLNFVHEKTLDHFLSHLAEYPGVTAEARMRGFLADCGVTAEQMESVRRILLR